MSQSTSFATGTPAANRSASIAEFPSPKQAHRAAHCAQQGHGLGNVVRLVPRTTKTRQTSFEQAASEVQSLEKSLQVLADAWGRLSADLAHAKARMAASRYLGGSL